ncbi:MAG: GTPase HflX [Acidobacteriota bacterium]
MNIHDEIGIERPRRAFLVGLILPRQPGYEVEEHLDELEQLVASAGTETVGRAVQSRRAPDPGHFIGKGKARQIGTAATEVDADLVVFDDDLSPSQVKNLEKIMRNAVMDRSALILEIFRQRARTREARTQVELAQLNYMLPRLTRRWRHLGRQAGGIGVRGGEGETQLEADRRMLRRRIKRLEKDLERIERTRETQRRGRRGTPIVALAGYTNAGKSTLFNRLADSGGARTADRLFATLDARLRRGDLDGCGPVIFTDTVGFIRKLPHHLVSSFRSTLGEIAESDVVLHVIDHSHPGWREQMEVAEEVLESLGVDRDRVVRVFNKTDRLAGSGGEAEAPTRGPREAGLSISARTGEGLAELRREIVRRIEDAPYPGSHTDQDSATERAPQPWELR